LQPVVDVLDGRAVDDVSDPAPECVILEACREAGPGDPDQPIARIPAVGRGVRRIPLLDFRGEVAVVITRRYRIDEAPQAFADLAAGKNARGVIVFD